MFWLVESKPKHQPHIGVTRYDKIVRAPNVDRVTQVKVAKHLSISPTYKASDK